LQDRQSSRDAVCTKYYFNSIYRHRGQGRLEICRSRGGRLPTAACKLSQPQFRLANTEIVSLSERKRFRIYDRIRTGRNWPIDERNGLRTEFFGPHRRVVTTMYTSVPRRADKRLLYCFTTEKKFK